ncbi:MAG: rhodanese-like domain-containing protein [Phycisphaerales bacterium]|nr:rhodanese-like domain-containing protein [Phycisphaerales bacterium]
MTARNRYGLLAILLMGGLLIASYWCRDGSVPTISPEEARQRLATSNAILVDVRTPQEFSQAHAEGTVNVPLANIEANSFDEELFKNRELLLICRSGRRSARAAELLHARGYTVFNVRGGMQKWNANPGS